MPTKQKMFEAILERYEDRMVTANIIMYELASRRVFVTRQTVRMWLKDNHCKLIAVGIYKVPAKRKEANEQSSTGPERDPESNFQLSPATVSSL